MGRINELLRLVVPHIKKYYGKEYYDIIDLAINDCCFYFEDKKTSNSEFKSFMENFFENKEFFELEFIANGFFDSTPIISGDKISSKRIIYMKYGNYKTESFVSYFVHELLHLIKSYMNEYVINGDKIVQRCGLVKCDLVLDNGKIKEENMIYDALDESINIYDESMIMSSILGRPYFTNAYNETIRLSIIMFKNFDTGIINALRKSLILGTNDFKETVGSENFEYLNNCFSCFINTYYEELEAEDLEDIKALKKKRVEIYMKFVKYFECEFYEKLNRKKY